MASRAQVILKPTEAKRLLSKAVLNLDKVKRVLEAGIVMIHPSSTSMFMLQELGFELPKEGIWVCGHISPKSYAFHRGMIDIVLHAPEYGPAKILTS
ncbi:hypothetical protein D4S03_04905 [bacterium]|nr:MAG: hypothetical protein D4S03_04905 [bacterium]